MTQTFKENTKKYKVLTPTGFQPFAGISMRGIRPLIRLEFENKSWIECTFNHKIYISDTEYTTANDLAIGDTVLSTDGLTRLSSKIDLNRSEPVYDLIEVDNGHRFYTNNILSSNCEFIIFEETLISALHLSNLTGVDPTHVVGQTRWYKDVNPHATYLIALDPSLGTGGDYASIQVFEMPAMVQVAEWRHNLTPVQAQIKHLREITNYIFERGQQLGKAPSIYYSIENNTIGEAALVVINDIGEDKFKGMFLSEPMKKGHIRRFRKGFNTTHRTKITACSRFKNLLETEKLKINSKALISELKTFIAQGASFSAKTGETDDLVSATLLIIRMAAVLAEWDATIYDIMAEKLTEEQYPLPIFVSSRY